MKTLLILGIVLVLAGCSPGPDKHLVAVYETSQSAFNLGYDCASAGMSREEAKATWDKATANWKAKNNIP